MPANSLPPPPAPPQPDRFQFSLKSILATMALTAMILALARAIEVNAPEMRNPPLGNVLIDYPKASVTYYFFGFLIVGLGIYLCLRLPYIWTYIELRYHYARQLSKYRRQLLVWAEETKAEKKKERELAEEQQRLSEG